VNSPKFVFCAVPEVRIAPVLCSRSSCVESLDSQPYVHKILIIHAGRIMAPSRVGPPDRGYGVDELSRELRLESVLRSSRRESLGGISYFPHMPLHGGTKEREGEKPMKRRRFTILFAAALVALVSVCGVSACGGGAGGGAQQKAQEAKKKVEKQAQEAKKKAGKKVQQGKQSGAKGSVAKTIQVKETEFRLKPAEITLDKPGTYLFKAVNSGGTVHALEVEGEGIEEETEEIELARAPNWQ
jgi:hypothetical protein